jgi:hypothetical protein
MIDFARIEEYRENNRIEAKKALGGLPESIWETYSAFANAEGGVILLGVEELADKSLHALDLLDPQWLLEDLRAGLNDPDRVSVNILTEEDIQIHSVDGKCIIAVTVPPAPAALRPVYVHQEGRWIAYFRRGEGDFRCTDAQMQQLYRRKEIALGHLRNLKAGLAAYLDAHYRPPAMEPVSACQVAECTPMAAGYVRQKKRAAAPMDLAERLKQTDSGFSETLLRLIDASGRKDSEIYSRANLSRQHFSKIRNNPGYRPTKTTALALAVALELDLAGTRDLIGRAGYALTGSSKLDVIVMYFIEQSCYDLNIINEALYEYDQSLLGA